MIDGMRQRLDTVRDRLDAWLFLPAPSTRGRFRGWEYALLLGAAFALLTVAELLRPGVSGSVRTVWAEDGDVVLQGILAHGFLHELFTVYPEYLIVYPRLVGGVATLFPLSDAAIVISVIASATIALSGIVTWFASSAHLRNPWLRGTFVVVLVLAPTAGLEAVSSAVYASWYMDVASFWILLYRPKKDLAAAAVSIFLLFSALSNPAVWFFAPLAGLRLLAIRNRRDAMIVGAYTLGSAIQVVAALQHSGLVEPTWSHTIWTAYLQRDLSGAVIGLHWSGHLWAQLGWTLLIGLIVLALVGLLTGLWHARPGARALALLAVGTSLLTALVSMYQRALGPTLAWPGGAFIETGGRYAIIPAMLLLAAALVLIDDFLARCRRPARLRVATIAVAMLLPALAVVSSFYLQETTARGDIQWKPALVEAEAFCATHPAEEPVTVNTSPPGFGIIIPCERLSGAS